MNSKSVHLALVHDNLNALLGHTETINCFNVSDAQWSILHNLFLRINRDMQDDVAQHLIKKSPLYIGRTLQLSTDLMDLLEDVWFNYTYGYQGDSCALLEYKAIRKEIVHLLSWSFYKPICATIHHLPGLGQLWANIMGKCAIHAQVAVLSKRLLQLHRPDVTRGWMHSCMSSHAGLSQNAVLQNAFLLPLVVDFIHNVLLDYLLMTHNNTCDASFDAVLSLPHAPKTNSWHRGCGALSCWVSRVRRFGALGLLLLHRASRLYWRDPDEARLFNICRYAAPAI